MSTDLLKSQINSIVSLSNEEWNQFLLFIESKKLKKNSYFLQEGQICESIAFINSGVLIYFKFLENGKEVTTDFAFRGDWVNDNQSRLTNVPSMINIKAITPSELLIIKSRDLPYLFEKIPKIERLSRILMEQFFIKFTQLSIDLQVLSAKERYVKMLKEYPEISQNVPLYHIANYLGIAPKSLSRLRNEIFIKK
ncbi:MAG: Crp/Fnr family transcriptional regulator [Bacteroidales bacterium]|jgi:CRP-like cAMP-binding protein|nr:Crp/Fnr family transcriptional regulator [Bacteroidales bacterium]